MAALQTMLGSEYVTNFIRFGQMYRVMVQALPSYRAHSAISSNRHTGLGLWDGDGSPDSLLRRSDGTLVVSAYDFDLVMILLLFWGSRPRLTAPSSAPVLPATGSRGLPIPKEKFSKKPGFHPPADGGV